MEKEISLKNVIVTLNFQLREPIRQKEWEEVPVKKLVVDSFPEPFRNPNAEASS
jgi:hypothetical protein